MKTKILTSLALSIIFLPLLIKNTESATQISRIKFQSKTTKIDTRKGTPNFPRWSNDGKTIYYFTPLNKGGYDLWQLSADTLESERIASNVTSSVFDVNSKSVAYIRKHELYIFEVTTGKVKEITLPKSLTGKPYPISWSPDGKFVSIYSGSGASGSIWVYTIQKGSFTRVAETNNDSPMSPDIAVYINMVAWSPNSAEIIYPVFQKNNLTYYASLLDGTKRIILKMPKNISPAESSWTNPDYIMLYGYNIEHLQTSSETDDFSEIHVLNLRSKKLAKLDINNIRSAWYPVLSPDGRWVVFYGRENNKTSKLILTNLKGSFIEILDDRITPGQAPQWSQDSKKIIYNKLLDSGAITLGLVEIPVGK